MKLSNKEALVYVPDGREVCAALSQVTHLAVGAHQDDLEIMAYHGVLECYDTLPRKFAGVVCTDGAGSARSGPYEKFSDQEMQVIRRQEQNQAATIGRYAAMFQLNHSSANIKNPQRTAVVADLLEIFSKTKAEVVYTHNLADKHDTHVAVSLSVISALRALPKEKRPTRLLGCEVWRNLDWLGDEEKVALNVGKRQNLAAALLGVFDSQIAGGKRYDLATIGRRLANATFFQSHAVDGAEQITFAMDLTPLIEDETLDLAVYVSAAIDRFKLEVQQKLRKLSA